MWAHLHVSKHLQNSILPFVPTRVQAVTVQPCNWNRTQWHTMSVSIFQLTSTLVLQYNLNIWKILPNYLEMDEKKVQKPTCEGVCQKTTSSTQPTWQCMERVCLPPTLHHVVHQHPTPCKKTTMPTIYAFKTSFEKISTFTSNLCWENTHFHFHFLNNIYFQFPWRPLLLSSPQQHSSLLSKPLSRKRPLSLSFPPPATPPRSQNHRGNQRHCMIRYSGQFQYSGVFRCWGILVFFNLPPDPFETCPHKSLFKKLCIPILSEKCSFWES